MQLGFGRPKSAPAVPAIGVFGKLPAHGDFFRFNVADPAAQAMIGWLQEAIGPVYQAGQKLPATARFFLRFGQTPSALVGAMVPGVDKVGRIFPLSIYAHVPAAAFAAHYPAVPGLYRGFSDAALELLAGATSGDGPALGAKASALTLPGEGELATTAASLEGSGGAEKLAAFAGRLFGEVGVGGLAYALATLEAATKQVKGREPARAPLALDCPAQSAADAWLWLELCRRALGWKAAPPFFWTDERVVISLGAPPAGLLAYLADPARPQNVVWPLRTDQPQAIEAARAKLGPALRTPLDSPDAEVRSLLAAAIGQE